MSRLCTPSEHTPPHLDIQAADCIEYPNTKPVPDAFAVSVGVEALVMLKSPDEVQVVAALKDAGLTREQVLTYLRPILLRFGTRYAYILGGLNNRSAN
jgi:hypothetical protein